MLSLIKELIDDFPKENLPIHLVAWFVYIFIDKHHATKLKG